MFDFTFYDLNLFGFFLLFTLMVVIYTKHEKYTLRGRLFRLLIVLTMFMLVMEIFSWTFDGLDGDWNRVLNIAANTLFTGVSVTVVSTWAIYIDHMIFTSEDRTRRRMVYYFTPAVIMMLLVTVNLFVPFIFLVDDANVYARLGGIWIAPILTYGIYIYVIYQVYTHRRRLTSNFLIGVTLFLLLPQLAVVAQLLFYGITVIWMTTAIAIVFSYLLFETTSSSIDYLTGVYTRLRAEDYMHTLLNRQRSFRVFMLDIDDFKLINDTYGHHNGDQLLIEMGRALQYVFAEKAVVSRFGGDEFIVVVETDATIDLERYRSMIFDQLATSDIPFISTARFSIGMADTQQEHASIEDLMRVADNNMYKDKAKNKNLKRRKDDK